MGIPLDIPMRIPFPWEILGNRNSYKNFYTPLAKSRSFFSYLTFDANVRVAMKFCQLALLPDWGLHMPCSMQKNSACTQYMRSTVKNTGLSQECAAEEATRGAPRGSRNFLGFLSPQDLR